MNKQKDVKHNTVYYTNWSGTEYLVLYDENRINKDHYIRLSDKTYAFNACFSSHSDFLNYLSTPPKGIIVKEATFIQDKWLRKCIKEGKYVECPNEEIINDYQIY